MKPIIRIFGRFRTKIILVFMSAMIIVCLASGLFVYKFASNFMFEKLRKQLINIAVIASINVDPSELLSIRLEPKSVDDPAYKKIATILKSIKIAVPAIKYIYIFRKDVSKPGLLRFVVDVDVEKKDLKAAARPGDEYDASGMPDLLEGFTAPSADKKICNDEWGATLSGYAPIRDATGNVVAVLGIDMTAEDVYKLLDNVKSFLALTLVLGVALSLILAIFVSGGFAGKVRDLKTGFERVAQGELDYLVRVKGNDELSDLAGYFNKMSVDLKEYIDKLNKTTADKERLLSELNIARKIQQSFLPDHVPVMPGIEIAAMTNPARVVGGDFYDFVPISKSKWGIVIADVSGKGVSAALFVALSRALIRSNVAIFDSPDMVVKNANARMIELSRSNIFETIFYGVLDAEHMIFSYANAGHNPPMVLGTRHGDIILLNSQTFPIGINPNMEITTTTQKLRRGDTIALYTDGATEAMNISNEEYGMERLTAALENSVTLPANDIIKKVEHDIGLFVGDREQHDDTTMIVIKVQ